MRAFLCIFFVSFCCSAASRNSGGDRTAPRVLAFEARDGVYVSRSAGLGLHIGSRGAVLNVRGHILRLSAPGARSEASIEALDRMPGSANYILGRDVRVSYRLYGGVEWRGIYPGVDVIFHCSQDHLEYDLHLAPRSHPSDIHLAFDGVDDLRVDRNGDLVVHAGALEIRQAKPFAYQIVSNKKERVEVAYALDTANGVQFRLGAYDRSRPLVIDPEIVFDKTFGGSGTTLAAAFARDAQGNLYITGTTNSADFPTVHPLQGLLGSAPLVVSTNAGKSWNNVFLGEANSVNFFARPPSSPMVVYAAANTGVYLSSDGGVTWNSTSGAGLQGQVTALAVDAQSAATLYAATSEGVFVSTDSGAMWTRSRNGLTGTGISVLTADPVHTGTVFAGIQNPAALFRSTDHGQSWTPLALPPSNIAGPVYVLAIGSDGTIIATTYNGPIMLSSDGGNTWTAGADLGVSSSQSLAISPADPKTVFIANNTAVLKSADGAQTFNTVFTFPQAEPTGLVAIDPRSPSTVYAVSYQLIYKSSDAGKTWSQLLTPYPIAPNAIFLSAANSGLLLGAGVQSGVFVTKLSPDGSQILYSTYFGGGGSNIASGIAADESGSAYVTGSTNAPDFPVTPGAYRYTPTGAAPAPGRPIFVAKLSPDGSQLSYAALLGSESFGGPSIAVDSSGEAVLTGSTPGSFPVTSNAFQSTLPQNCPMQPDPLSGYLAPTAAFVTKLAASGASLVFSTLLGGSCATYGQKLAIDASGNAWVVGSTISPDFPVTADALQPKYGGGPIDGDGFLARFSPAGNLDYATYIGGPGYDALTAVALDSSGNVYVTGETAGLTQPSSPGAHQPKASASCYAFGIGPSFYEPQGNAVVLKLDPQAHSVLGLTIWELPAAWSLPRLPWIPRVSRGLPEV